MNGAISVEATTAKLHWLEEQVAKLQRQPPKPGHRHLRDLSLRSLKKMMNRLQEDLVRAENAVFEE